MDWNKGYSASYYAAIVDPATWRDIDFIRLTGGTIKRIATGLRQSATIACTEQIEGIEQWIRIYLDAKQGSDSVHEALFTGLVSSPKRRVYYESMTLNPNCYSVLKPVDDVLLPRGWYALSGSNTAQVIRSVLSATPAPVDIVDNIPTLSTTIVAEEGETRLTMLDKILLAINWRIRIDGTGIIHIVPFSGAEVARLDPEEYDIIEAPIEIEQDLYSCPNVYMATSGDVTGIARDDSEESPFSIKNRGREVWAYESDVNLSTAETIAEYALRRLKAAQRVRKIADYDRRFVPQIHPTDVINLHYPAQGLDGLYMVSQQTLKLGYACRTAESVEEL